MEITYICPYWGQEHLAVEAFVAQAIEAGYDGVELNIRNDPTFVSSLHRAIKTHRAILIAQQWLPPAEESCSQYRDRMVEYLHRLAAAEPLFINSHTGKDHFSFEENCSLIEECMTISARSGIPIVHETHRGRFPYHTQTVIPYLERYSDLALTADFSHFCVVSESLLEDQGELLDTIIPRCRYIHARVGHDQAPQVNHPFAPEWEPTRLWFLGWWQKIVESARQQGIKTLSICPEFGPAPYMPTLPFTQKPVADQWAINVQMMLFLKENLQTQ